MAFDHNNNTENLVDERTEQQAVEADKVLKDNLLTDRVFYSKAHKSFWVIDRRKEWTEFTKDKQIEKELKECGICPIRDDKHANSELDRVTLHITKNLHVAYAGPLAGHKKGMQINNGERVLVTRSPSIPTMNPDQACPIMFQLLDQIFGEEQQEYFLAWWKHSIECLINGYKDTRGLAVVLAGDAGCGKSLMKDIIAFTFGGRICTPYQFMIGREKFNQETLGAELWAIDDEQALTDMKSRSEFGANIKRVVADRTYRVRGMHSNAVNLNFFKRLVICVNRQPERLIVLPQLDDDISGKMSIFLCSTAPMPMPADTTGEKELFWDSIEEEVPGFLHWLMHVWPDEKDLTRGRFGAKHYHNADLCCDLYQMSTEFTLWNQINKVFFGGTDTDLTPFYLDLNATEIFDRLAHKDAPLTDREKNNLPRPTFLGGKIATIAKQHPTRIRKRKSNGRETWVITADGRTTNEAMTVIQSNAAFKRAKAKKEAE